MLFDDTQHMSDLESEPQQGRTHTPADRRVRAPPAARPGALQQAQLGPGSIHIPDGSHGWIPYFLFLPDFCILL